MKLAITGATGHLGSQLARQLSEAKIETRLLARRPEAVEKLPYTTVFESYYDNSEITLNSLKGIEVFSGRESQNRVAEHKALIIKRAQTSDFNQG
ncbi:NAD-dependent epimerase/dehydratase family protein [Ligilactobacillus hayakitensis]|nr:NmrA family NAD(P)-binding protein [Ligilactobacillus hayakitensis]